MKKSNYLLWLLLVLALTVSSCSSNRIQGVYEMNEQQAINWIKENKINIPEDLNNDELGETILIVFNAHQKGQRASDAISYDKTRDFMKEIESKLDSMTSHP